MDDEIIYEIVWDDDEDGVSYDLVFDEEDTYYYEIVWDDDEE